MAIPKEVLKALHDLVATCNDAAEGFGKAAKAVRNRELGNWLAQAGSDRERFATEINHALRHLGQEAHTDLHEGGILHKGWVDLEQRVDSKNDAELIGDCITGENGTRSHYEHALGQEVAGDLRQLLIEQKTGIEDDMIYLEQQLSRHAARRAQAN